jgi:hypothetical protein
MKYVLTSALVILVSSWASATPRVGDFVRFHGTAEAPMERDISKTVVVSAVEADGHYWTRSQELNREGEDGPVFEAYYDKDGKALRLFINGEEYELGEPLAWEEAARREESITLPIGTVAATYHRMVVRDIEGAEQEYWDAADSSVNLPEVFGQMIQYRTRGFRGETLVYSLEAFGNDPHEHLLR